MSDERECAWCGKVANPMKDLSEWFDCPECTDEVFCSKQCLMEGGNRHVAERDMRSARGEEW